MLGCSVVTMVTANRALSRSAARGSKGCWTPDVQRADTDQFVYLSTVTNQWSL